MMNPITLEARKENRITHLKEIIKLIDLYLEENCRMKQLGHENNWQNPVVENNIAQLKKLRKKIKYLLHPDILTAYLDGFKYMADRYPADNINRIMFEGVSDFAESTLEFTVSRYSYAYSITYDFYWAKDGNIGDYLAILKGESSPDILEQYCPAVLSRIEKQCNDVLRRYPAFSVSVKLLKDVIENYGKLSPISINLIVASVIESLVRELCIYLYGKQNPGTTKEESVAFVRGKQSLEVLIEKGAWKNDLPIPLLEAVVKQEYIKDAQLEFALVQANEFKRLQNKLIDFANDTHKILKSDLADTEKGEKAKESISKAMALTESMVDIKGQVINISLRVELQFLMRRYRNMRNSIIHGSFANFDKGWYCYNNFSALSDLIETIQKYFEIYPETEFIT